ncbi:MAG: N4-gp56 family major capsid protein [Oscillospiraceae bacterium]|nr:N4-gp56 family major capsid protein [Oscillospiraceae bacterium]
MLDIKKINLQLFADMNTQTTATEGLSGENKTYYSDYLIDLVEAELVHDQFGQKHPIPKNGGKTIEFRQWEPLPEMTTPLQEGVTPDGQDLSMSTIEATVDQYGGYVTISDMLDLTAIDPVLVQGTKAIASQAGRSLDTITREVLNGGTNVQYAEGQVESRAALKYTSEEDNCNLTVKAIKKAVRTLEDQDAPKIDGYYVAIIHPFCKFDLMNDPEWRKPHEYVNTENIYKNEIGEIAGVRFVQSTRAKVFAGAGANGADVYSTLIMGDDAYGITDITGGGLEHIIKQKGSAGTADPLNQRATCGWKATKVAELLVPQYMVRVETTATP